MDATPNRWKALREIAGLSQREVGRRAGINSGRLSIIERGVQPTEDESRRLWAVLVEASAPKEPA
jgi:transcriptional regulator with XRE-family HTH domain